MHITLSSAKTTWSHFTKPSSKEMEEIKKQHGFHALDIEDCLSLDLQQAKMDEYDDYLFVTVQAPIFNPRTKSFSTIELKAFLGKGFVYTICAHEDERISVLFDELQKNEKELKHTFGKGPGYILYRILKHFFKDCLSTIQKIEKKIHEMEGAVFAEDTPRDMVKEIMIWKRNVLTLQKIFQPQRGVILQLEHKDKKFISDELTVYLDDIVDQLEKVWATLQMQYEIITSLQQTNEALISHTTNSVVKILTVFSGIILLPTFITSMYGMNVDLPFQHSSVAFIIIFISMIVSTLGLTLYFWWKKWI